jgi:hypothetical protein
LIILRVVRGNKSIEEGKFPTYNTSKLLRVTEMNCIIISPMGTSMVGEGTGICPSLQFKKSNLKKEKQEVLGRTNHLLSLIRHRPH